MKGNNLVLIGSLGLAGMFYLWLGGMWWKLGFSLVNTGFLILMVVLFGKTKKNWFWWMLWSGSLVLGGLVAIRSNSLVSGLNILLTIGLNLVLATLIKEVEAKLGFARLVASLFEFGGSWLKNMFKGVAHALNKLPKNLNISKKIFTGVILSIPLLLLFGALFYLADPIFANLIRRINLTRIDLRKLINFRNMSTLVFFGGVITIMRQTLSSDEGVFKAWKHVGEVQVASMILQGLFLIFAVIQIGYFGVTAETLRTMGISFSDYTRQGYGQMIIVCMLAWGIIYGLDYLKKSQKDIGDKNIKITNYLGWAFGAEILLFIAAATKRNWLYQSAYGFTQARLLGFWLSAWLATIVVITLIKFIKSEGEDFLVRRIIATSVVILIGLNIFNIDRTIAVMRPAKLVEGVDYKYMANLSSDALEMWDEILTKTEEEVGNKQVGGREGLSRLRVTVAIMGRKEEKLKRQSENNWNYWGNWNYADAKAWEKIQGYKDRMAILESKLDQIETEFRLIENTKREEVGN